mmetsp:Transcript_21644/g.15483  ORF Transcript_21644/g.15483 Transcript_21644/m.15483 type:complete len:86 (-) Transcript_21644:344-601(-)
MAVILKISGLGLAKQLDKNSYTRTYCGNLLFMAPERINGLQYNYKCDIWSIGAIFFNLITGLPPFTGDSKDQFIKNVAKGDVNFP